MEQKGVQHGVVVKRGGWTEEQLRSLPVKTHSLPFGGALDLITPIRYPRILHQARANIVMSQLERATKRTPRGPWIHVARLGGYYELKDYRHCDYLVGNTPGCLEYFRSGGWPEERIHYIPNFVPEAELGVKPEARADHDTPDGVPLIVWLGRIEREKGPDLVVRALKDVPGAYLWMAGAGRFEEELKALAAELGLMDRIRFLGWRNDVHSLLKAADLFVCASRFEVLGNIILEAWTHRLPVVAVRSPGPEHLIKDGVTGLLVPNEDPEAMAAAFNRLIGNRDFAKTLGEAGFGEVQSVYSEEAVVGEYYRFFERLVAERASKKMRA
jgi:glycosyltransferase involved in cell wall biosynthesis